MSRKRLILALTVAAVSDFISLFVALVPPLQWVLDMGTAFALFILLGWRWQILPGLILEATPLGVFPIWLLVVAWVGAQDEREKLKNKNREVAGLPQLPPSLLADGSPTTADTHTQLR